MSTQLHPLTGPTPPKEVIMTRVFQDGIELNWLPPTEPNGEVHYVIYYTPENGTEQSIVTESDLTHYDLRGTECTTTLQCRLSTQLGCQRGVQ